jgi:exodeoxyribonuclease I
MIRLFAPFGLSHTWSARSLGTPVANVRARPRNFHIENQSFDRAVCEADVGGFEQHWVRGTQMAFVFYDLETTGTATAFDQILQFAAIRTDNALNVLETFNIRCRLLPYVVPSPGALLVTGVEVTDLIGAPLSHFEMMRQIHSKMTEWSAGGAIFIGWNSMRFDEIMLRQGYYQTLLPIYQTNTNGNGRADLMRMAQVVSACLPNSIVVPRDASGKRIFKLGAVAEANAVALNNAHEAMSDTQAVLEIAGLMRRAAPKLWDALIANARKAAPLRLIRDNSVLLLSESYWGAPYNFIVAPIAANVTNSNEWGVFDLQFDPLPFLNADEAALRNAIDGKVKRIRRVSTNAQPSLLSLEFAPDDIRGGRLPITTYLARAQAVREQPDFCRRVGRLLADRYTDQTPPCYVEDKIYSSFAASVDEVRMRNFQGCGWPKRRAIIDTLEDDRFRELGNRVFASERFDLLSDEEGRQWRSWRHDRLLANGDVPWLTIPAARAQLNELKDSSSDSHECLNSLDRFLKQLCP